jgi:putative tryptophan/tyrosine transport system substrate-binding protein
MSAVVDPVAIGVAALMRRRDFITLFVGASVAWPLAARSQTATIPRVGLLDPRSAGGSAESHYWKAFREQMRALGYAEGKNIIFEFRAADGDPSRLPELTSDLIAHSVSLIVALSTPAALAAKSVTTKVPIVVALMADPVGIGLVASLARPGGNITGLSTISAELSAKRLELLREMIPDLSRAAIIWEDSNPAFALTVTHSEAAAHVLGVSLKSIGVKAAGGFEKAMDEVVTAHAQALIVAVPDRAVAGGTELTAIIGTVARRKIPAVYAETSYVEAGGLVSYGPDYTDLFRRAATYADKILKGARPVDLPVEEPTKFELALNLKTAKALGLTVPQTLLVAADEVIE